ncbi:MAG: hypothetical protein ACRDZ9_02535 [Acidimicrobiales bacterium]
MTRLADQRGVVGINLAIVLAFALFAVIQLTRTTLAAQQIDDRVEIIVDEVQPIDEDLDQVAVLDEVDETAKGILTAAQPLSGQADEILAAAQSIDGKVVDILSTVGSINTVVKDINANAVSINGTAKGINGNLAALTPVVNAINGGSSMIGVSGINQRADRIIGQVSGIKGDLDPTLGHVVNIDDSSRSICNSTVISGGC